MEELKKIPATLQLYVLVANAVKYMHEKIDNHNEHDLSKNSMLTVLLIHYMPGVNQNKVATILQLDKTTTGRIIWKLEKDGYLVRDQDEENKRSNILFQTQKTIDLARDVKVYIEEYFSILQESFTSEQQTELKKMVTTMMFNSIDIENEKVNWKGNK